MDGWIAQKIMKNHPHSQPSKSDSPVDGVCLNIGKVDLQHWVEILTHQFQYAHLSTSIDLLHKPTMNLDQCLRSYIIFVDTGK